MNALDAFVELAGSHEWREDVHFAVVYLEEAHPTDGWMYGAVEHMISSHKDMAARRAAAQTLRTLLNDRLKAHRPEFKLPLYIDRMDNAASDYFGALPERLVILKGGGEIAWIGGKGPEEYRVGECAAALTELIAQSA